MDNQQSNIERFKQIIDLSREVLQLARNTLLVNLRFLDMALSVPKLEMAIDIKTIGTNGSDFYYDPMYVLNTYKVEKEEITRAYLHMVMHCIFRHMYLHTLLDNDMWDLACDIAIENAINELDLRSVSTTRQARQVAVINELRSKVKLLTAEKIYAYLREHPLNAQKYDQYIQLFTVDNHMAWYLPPSSGNGGGDPDENSSQDDEQSQSDGQSPGSGDDQNSNRQNENGNDNNRDSSQNDKNSQGQGNSASSPDFSNEQTWKDISERIKQDLETFSHQQGKNAGGLLQNIAEVNREKYDYSTFLKKFSVMGEAMKINDDEFDYIFYTYGLKLYKKMPLVEPLEYKEVKRIKEFVIAIDTSGSVQGELVQTFIKKTYNILKSTETFFSKINLHIIQCDAEIQSDTKITTQEEFDSYIKNMKLRGFGGTDFRPVFSYVNKLIKEKEFTNLKGLIYFTDGCGTFPSQKPDYNTAFVFIDDDYNNPDVPSWAIKLVLSKDEI